MFTLEKALTYTKLNGECLEWTRCFNTDGYPRAAINGNYNGKVHRFVYECVTGETPQVVRHTCDNPRCINPEHLIAGTPFENVRDRHDRKRTFNYVSENEIQAVLNLRLNGLTYKEISHQLDIKTRRIEYIIRRFGG